MLDVGSGTCRSLRRYCRGLVQSGVRVQKAVGIEENETIHKIANGLLSERAIFDGLRLEPQQFENLLCKADDYTGYGKFCWAHIHTATCACAYVFPHRQEWQILWLFLSETKR
jgi:hypothetical protein